MAAPARLPLGATTGVTLTLPASCGDRHGRLDVVLVIDRGCGSMAGERLRFLHQGGPAFIDAMDQAADRIAVVATHDESNAARLVVPPTNDKDRLQAALAGWKSLCLQGGGGVEDGLRVGRETLLGFMGRPDAGKVLVLVAQGANSHRDIMMWEAQRLWSAGVRTYTIAGEPDAYGGGGLADNGLLAAMASRPGDYLHADPPDALLGIYGDLGRDLSDRVLFRSLIITDRIPLNMQLVPGSVRLAQPLGGDAGRLGAALRGLVPAPGTRIDLGLALALDELQGPRRRPTADRALVLLADGLPSAGTEPEVRAAARRARDARVEVFAIGLGADVDPALLAAVTGDARRVYLAPTERDLAAIYADIARLVPCR